MATKHVCDRCGEERDWSELINIEEKIPGNNTRLTDYVRHDLCKTCYEGFINFLHDFDNVLYTEQGKEAN